MWMKGTGGQATVLFSMGRSLHTVYLLALKLDAGGLNLCPLETSIKDLWGGGVRSCVVFLLAVNGLGQILQGHPQLLTKFPVPS